MRTLLATAVASLALAACATSPDDAAPTGGHGGGGKADGDYASSCPVQGDADAILSAIEKGGNCYTAAGIAESCAYGSSIDVQFVGAAYGVCASGFGAMSADMKKAYDTLVARCGAKYENESGTLYRSMAAFCTLEVTQFFNELYPETMTSEPAVAYSPECPVDASNADKIETAIAAQPACSMAADVAEVCAWGSSIDVQFVAAAAEKCTAAADMTAADKAIADSLHQACADHLADEGGTLGRSMLAFCNLHVDVLFDSLYAPVE